MDHTVSMLLAARHSTRSAFSSSREGCLSVESRCGAVAVGRAYLLPPLSFGGASLARPWLRFHTPLIEPDVQISRIRLSDKTSRLRPRLAAPSRSQAYETVMPVEGREGISPALGSPDLVLVAQPPTQPHGCVVIEGPIRLTRSARFNLPTSIVVSC